MSIEVNDPIQLGTIRKLFPAENHKFRDHLLRLDKESRRSRFGHTVADSFVKAYAERLSEHNSVVYGYFIDGVMRAAAELRKVSDTWGKEAEAAFSVERPYQDSGVGSNLMGRIIQAARNRGVEQLYIICMAENTRMQRIAKKHQAVLRFEQGEVVGRIKPAWPSALSVLAEAVDDQRAYVMMVLDLQSRLMPTAA
jgi:GNAT superfamily N-acetyltransferase